MIQVQKAKHKSNMYYYMSNKRWSKCCGKYEANKYSYGITLYKNEQHMFHHGLYLVLKHVNL